MAFFKNNFWVSATFPKYIGYKFWPYSGERATTVGFYFGTGLDVF